MSELTIELADGRTSFRPLEEINGVASWRLEDAPRQMTIELFWTTRGKGNVDMQVVDALHLESPPPSGQRPFRFRLPEAPYSFSGKLVSLIWGLRLATKPYAGESQVNIVVSPTGEEIDLTASG